MLVSKLNIKYGQLIERLCLMDMLLDVSCNVCQDYIQGKYKSSGK